MRFLSFAFFALFLVLTLLYLSQWTLHSFDEAGIQFAFEHRSLLFNSFMTGYSGLGAPPATTTLSIVALVLFLLKKQKRAAIQIAFTMGGIVLWSPLLKHLFERSRPNEAFRLIEVTGYSFPSGHALDSTTLYVCLTLIAFSFYSKRSEQLLLSAICTIVLFLIAVSRVYLGVHYPLDVLAGISFGLAWSFMVHAQFARKFATPPQRTPAPDR